MTEEEAKTKWCPFARVLDSGKDARIGYVAANRWQGPLYGTDAARCIGSSCMAWRTTPVHQENVYNSAEAPEGEGWKLGSPIDSRWWWRTVGGPPDGYCGLAGAQP